MIDRSKQLEFGFCLTQRGRCDRLQSLILLCLLGLFFEQDCDVGQIPTQLDVRDVAFFEAMLDHVESLGVVHAAVIFNGPVPHPNVLPIHATRCQVVATV